MLRNVVNCTLPVEVHHYEREMKDQAIRYELEHKYQVTLVQSKAQFTDGKPWRGCRASAGAIAPVTSVSEGATLTHHRDQEPRVR